MTESTAGSNGANGDGAADEPLELAPAEVGYVLARLADDYTRCLRELLGMTLWLPVKGSGQNLIVTHRGDRKLIRAYTSPARVRALAAPDVDPDNALLRPFAELIRQWASDDLGLVINPESDTELQLPQHLFPKILQLREQMIEEERQELAERRPGPVERVAPIEPPSEIGTFRFASLMDGVDSDGRPLVSPQRPRITDPGEKQRIREYLNGGAVLQMVAGLVGDVYQPEKGAVVPANTRTDGRWIWQDGLAYYLDNYDIGPDPAFYQHIQEQQYACPEVNEARAKLAGRALQEQQRIAGEMYQRWQRDQRG